MVAITKTSWMPPQEPQSPLVDAANSMMTLCPFRVRIDNQEKTPWVFSGIPADKSKVKGGKESLWLVETLCDSHLTFGDYAIVDLEQQFRIERKSKEDMYGTIAAYHQHHGEEKKKQRINPDYEPTDHWFHRQLEGLNSLNGFGHLIVEATFPDFLIPPSSTQFKAKSASRTVLSWMQKFPLIHWHFPGNRRTCEVYSFQLMFKFFDHFSQKDK